MWPFGLTFSPATETLVGIEQSTCGIQVHLAAQLLLNYQFCIKYLPESYKIGFCQIEIIGPITQRKLNFEKS